MSENRGRRTKDMLIKNDTGTFRLTQSDAWYILRNLDNIKKFYEKDFDSLGHNNSVMQYTHDDYTSYILIMREAGLSIPYRFAKSVLENVARMEKYIKNFTPWEFDGNKKSATMYGLTPRWERAKAKMLKEEAK